ncbi:MAG: mycothiol synthase [Acidimicrobiales bacterium]
MPRHPAIDATSTPGDAGRIPVAGTGIAVTYATRGPTGELGIFGTGPAALAPVVAEALDALRSRHPDVAFHLAADHPVDALDPLPEATADRTGLPHRRDLMQLRRPLPVPADLATRRTAPPLALRSIDLGASDGGDVAAWLRVNNRAFAHHPDQGAETVETLRERLGPEWDDPSGFLVADDETRPGELSGFCWTKVHPATGIDPALGEIYVIGVDPSHRGEGLGPSFVLAGLDHLARIGLDAAMLYVDADNAQALRLYDHLGFAVHRRRRVYSAEPQ